MRGGGGGGGGAPLLRLAGHTDTVTGLALSPDGGERLLSFAMDGALRAWDMRPCPTAPPAEGPHRAPGVDERCVKVRRARRESESEGTTLCSAALRPPPPPRPSSSF